MKEINFCQGWKFKKQGAETARLVDLPHDAMIHESRAPQAASGSAEAFFPGGVYEYEKSFFVSDDWAEKSVVFKFEGVYKNSTVYLNGEEAGGCAYGYSQFYIHADKLLRYGEENRICVIASNDDQPNSRWYTGSGIYRPVWFLLSEKSHIDSDGIKISTLSYNLARVRVDTSYIGGDTVTIEVLDNGQIVTVGRGKSVELEIPNAKLWSDTTPNLYQCRVTLLENGVAVDEVTETFGIRLVEWSAKGLFINGENTLLRGGCIHHDNGILGACCYAKSEERRVRLMKAAGFNAIRSAHNPASTALLDACDRLGMYMIDETWDMWYNHKSKNDYAKDFTANYQFDVKSIVDRDFNHPSVIMYSIGNEVSEPATEKGIKLTKELVDLFHSLDGNRAVTGGFNLMIIDSSARGKGIYKEGGGLNQDKTPDMSGMSSTMFNMITAMVGTRQNKAGNSKRADAVTSPSLDALDIAGYNYGSGRYPLEGRAHPDRVIFGAETFPQDIVKNWKMVKKYPFLIGDFMWTAWDYLGENGLGAWAYTPDGKGFDKPYPWLLADAGALDILGNPTGEIFLAQASWGLLKNPAIAVQPVNHPGVKPAKMVWRGTNAIPGWSWKNCEGNRAVVEVYTDAYIVELRLNGECGSIRIGRKRVKNCVAVFKTKYAPGKLAAVGYDINGNETGRGELEPAAGKISICVKPEEDVIRVEDIIYVNIELVGENGVVECNADTKITVSVEGGKLLAFGSANPRTPESYTSGNFTTYYGRAQAVVRADTAGTMRITASGDRLEPASAEITVVE
ncbi:MAG: DUF4982 domain-containing protein [Spirochaetaceae bacterium]|jgi:hypothetical protein|nr:DUF4982 domain-containing protein [Spirochaetaceae bacterium]